MMTNILAAIIVSVVTNTYAPKQYYDNTYGCLVYGCTADHGSWVDQDPGLGWSFIPPGARERENPDVRITEVREVRTLTFDLDGKTWRAELSNRLLSSTKRRRVVNEQWVDQESGGAK